MKFIVFVPPDDFKDESISLIKLFFDKWGVNYKITSYSSKECVGSHGAVYKPDINASKIDPEEYDGMVLIDGGGIDSYKLYDYRPLLDLVIRLNNQNKFIVGINNSIKIAARANIVKDKKVSARDEETIRLVTLFHGLPSQNDFEIAGNLITIKNSGSIENSMHQILEHMGVT